MFTISRIDNMLVKIGLTDFFLINPVAFVALFKNVIVHQNGSLFEHEKNLRLKSVIEHGDEQALLANDSSDDLDEYFVFQIGIEHLQYFILVQFFFLLVLQPLLEVPSYLLSQGCRYFLLQQVLVDMQNLLLELVLDCVRLANDSFY